MLKKLIRYFLENRLITILLLLVFIGWGTISAPFNWHIGFLPRNPVPVDAIPDIGDNQQIVATEWMGRSPKDIEDQISYPLTSALLGIPGVKTIRSTSMFGMSFIYIIFKDDVEFYWSRSRILEKLNSLPSGTLPQGVQPSLGPDATALGQIFWYTLEGRDPKTGKPNGGWDPQELRTIQDYYVKYALASADGVSEVASIGGYVKEYQVDIDPDAMKSYGVTVMDIMKAVKNSNLDIGAETVELNKVEYVIRGLGYLKNLDDLRNAVVSVRNNVPVRVGDVAKVSFGPATRRGGLDKSGAEAAGAVVVARYGSNPMEVINNVKAKIKELEPGLPDKTLADGSVSKVAVVPFYDRTGLIQETIGTLESALTHEVLISIIVIIILLFNLRASVIISSLLPIAVLMTFIVMHLTGVEANIVALSGIAIAIGVMVDVGIIFVENIFRHLEMPENHEAKGTALRNVIYNATIEVSPAVITALATTVVSFLPVFAMQAAEGKLFKPLAFTKTFALLSSFVLGIIVLPMMADIIFSIQFDKHRVSRIWNTILIIGGLFFTTFWGTWPALALVFIGINNLIEFRGPERRKRIRNFINIAITVLVAVYFLSHEWLPLGAHVSFIENFLFVAGITGFVITLLMLMVHFYEPILRWCLKNKWKFLLLPLATFLLGVTIWLGFNKTFGFLATGFEKAGLKIRQTTFWQAPSKVFPGVGKEFMPSLDEGSFLLMPASMPHAGVEQNIRYVKMLDKRLESIPEVEVAVGKWGRVNSALDPAPVQMFENTINYKPEYVLDADGHRMRFKTNKEGDFLLSDSLVFNPKKDNLKDLDTKLLIPDNNGDYFRQWRPAIKKPDDIWNEIVKVTNLPGLTSAPKLQPIQTRLVMLSTGMRAPMGLKVYGPDLETIESTGLEFEKILKEVPSVVPSSVFYDRAAGAPYIEIKLNRVAIARYGMSISEVQDVLQSAVGGMVLTTTVEGRERFPVRVRYPRELRTTPEDLKKILIPSMTGMQVPLGELADLQYTKGPQMIRSENTFLAGYVIFDKQPAAAEVDVVEKADAFIKDKIESGELKLAAGVSYKFAGNYEQQVRATKRLSIVLPISLALVFMLLFFQFKTFTASSIHFSGVFVAFAGGFIMIWLYGQPWFMNFSLSGVNMRDLFQMHTINLSVAVWVGFIALFGISTNDGVIMGTYIHQVFEEVKPGTVRDVREAVVMAGKKRVRPAMMTAAVAIIALLPVLTSTGKGADIMVPMAIPTFGGMIIQIMTMFVVPVFQCIWREGEIKKRNKIMVQSVSD
jgi:Cu(I)/Ag(I) efflux system membrane protein CusA/SilA